MASRAVVKTWADRGTYPVVGFRLYWADGTVTEGEPLEFNWRAIVPLDGVQVMVLYYDRWYLSQIRTGSGTVTVRQRYKDVISDAQWYWFLPSSPTVAFGTADSLPDVPAGAIAKSGTTTSNFWDIYNRAQNSEWR